MAAKRLGWKSGFLITGLLSVLLAPTVPASYLMEGVDPERSNRADSEGPTWNDIAFSVRIPASGSAASPLIIGDSVYVLGVSAAGLPDPINPTYHPRLNETGIFRIHLSNGTVEKIIHLPNMSAYDKWTTTSVYTFASDGSEFFVSQGFEIGVYPLAGGARVWAWRPQTTAMTPEGAHYCAPPAVTPRVVYLGCRWEGAKTAADRHEDYHTIYALDRSSRAPLWLPWVRTWGQYLGAGPVTVGPYSTPDPAIDWGYDTTSFAVVGKVLIMYMMYDWGFMLDVVERDTGKLLKHTNFHHAVLQETNRDIDRPCFLMTAMPVADQHFAYLKDIKLRKLDLTTREATDLYDFQALPGCESGSGMVLHGGNILVATRGTLISFDTRTFSPTTVMQLPYGEEWGYGPVLLAGQTLFARSVQVDHRPLRDYGPTQGNSSRPFQASERWTRAATVHAIDAVTHAPMWNVSHRPLWTAPYPFTEYKGDRFSTMAVADGVLVNAYRDGTVTVVGRTPASIHPAVKTSTRYPQAGQPVHVDLSDTRPGVFGPPTSFKAVWGDGSPDNDWQASPRFSHVYARNMNASARFYAANAAGQNASEVVEFFVGGSEPATALVPAPPSPEVPAAAPGLLDRWVAAAGIAPTLLSGIALVLGLFAASVVILRRRESDPKDRFAIKRELHRGTESHTYLAEDTLLHRNVVLKTPVGGWIHARRNRARFLKEARLLASLRHPNVVTLHEVLADEDPPVLVLEWVDGGNARDLLAAGSLAPEAAVGLVLDILGGLQYVHAHGIVHRDLKPANVLIDEGGRAKVTDFGVAQAQRGATPLDLTLSTTDSQSGTVAYMSPEQARGERADTRSDLYSTGAIAYELLTGRHYLDAGNGPQYLLEHRIQSEYPALPDPAIPAPLDAVIAKSLAKDPAGRFPTAAAFEQAFRRAAGQAFRGPSGKGSRPLVTLRQRRRPDPVDVLEGRP